MIKELRGRKTNDYHIENVIDIEHTINMFSYGEAFFDDVQDLEREFGLDIALGIDDKKRVSIIQNAILQMYNDDITASVLLLYNFVLWYKNAVKALARNEHYEEREQLLDFRDVLTLENITNIWALLSKEYNKDDYFECVKHYQYKMISIIKPRIIAENNLDYLHKIEQAVNSSISNCKYLNMITRDLGVNLCFLLQWEYYPVDKVFRDVVDTFNSELNRSYYFELSGNEFMYFNKIMKAEVDFSSIKSLPIVKDGKRRTVYLTNKPIDKAALMFLSKRINNEFHISYPNRDRIMEVGFNLIDSLPRLDNYTIYKFDFKDFFESVEIKSVYDKYIDHSNLYSYEKELILKLAKKYKYCAQGLPISNALIEVISRDFDEKVKASFSEDGLIFYKRYVDDCILIFNHRLKKEYITERIRVCRDSTFSKKVLFSAAKTSYQTKFDGDETFDYLGYSFTRRHPDKDNKGSYYFEFGISGKKIEKYKKQLDAFFAAYERDCNERFLLRRIQYYDSRIVFYNYDGSKYVNKCTWDVRGIINSYRMLRRYVIFDDCLIKDIHEGKKVGSPYKIQKDTYKFLRYYVKEKRDSLTDIPQYLQGKGCENHTLWSGFLKNKSIVFQPNIGWSNDLLSNRLIEVGGTPVHKSYYEKTRDYYTALLKKL